MKIKTMKKIAKKYLKLSRRMPFELRSPTIEEKIYGKFLQDYEEGNLGDSDITQKGISRSYRKTCREIVEEIFSCNAIHIAEKIENL